MKGRKAILTDLQGSLARRHGRTHECLNNANSVGEESGPATPRLGPSREARHTAEVAP
jgi:hypothetical protein